MARVIYYSSESGNTERFIAKLGEDSLRVPISPKAGLIGATEPYVLIVPSYSDGNGRGAVPKAIIRFLNDAENRAGIRGVIGSGNLNFGEFYCHAAKIIAAKCGVPLLYKFELMGSDEDVERVRDGLKKFWRNEDVGSR